jgi:hypothetical protein
VNKYLALSIAFSVVVFNGILDHFFAPVGIEILPLVIITGTCLINLNREKFSIMVQSILTFALISISDIGIKLYGGGFHDSEGLGFIFLFTMIGLIPSSILLIFIISKNNDSSIQLKISSIFVFLLLLFLYFNFCGNLGLGRYYPINV